MAGDHRGAIVFALTVAVPEPFATADGDHVIIEGDLDGRATRDPGATACEQAVGAGFEAVGGECVNQILHWEYLLFSWALALSLILL